MNLKDLDPKMRVTLILGLVFMLLGSIVTLTIVGKDAAGIYTFGGAILIGLGIMAGVTGQVASNTNGNTGRMLDQLAESQRVNAQMMTTMTSMVALMTPSSKEAETRVMELTVPPAVVAPTSPAPAYNGDYDSTLHPPVAHGQR